MSSEVNLGFSVLSDNSDAFAKALRDLIGKSVLAGFPEGGKPREDEDGNPEPISNAELGYIHNTGMPEQNIPARPFMVEGIEDKREPITEGMEKAGHAALDGDTQRVDKELKNVATYARDGIKGKILDGPFQPLAEATILARSHMKGKIGKAARAELQGVELVEGSPNVRPLNLSGQLRNAVQGLVEEN